MTKYLLIAIGVLSLLLAISGTLLKEAWEENAKIERQLEYQAEETRKANKEIENLKVLHAEQITKQRMLAEENQRDAVELRQRLKAVQELRSTTGRAALEEPERFGRIATFRLRRGLRDVCRSSGGTQADCKIEIPKPSATTRGATAQPDTENSNGVAVPD